MLASVALSSPLQAWLGELGKLGGGGDTRGPAQLHPVFV